MGTRDWALGTGDWGHFDKLSASLGTGHGRLGIGGHWLFPLSPYFPISLSPHLPISPFPNTQ
ncbi:hypothetical protein H6H03_00890 [Nostoc paludosum FACHB-159]|uniref:Uncharacterized protein n=1 Tax=Nostoc paludosum FACHB-159 TaxID=2692908 RepID=A0ABR8JYJ6_9NOSO|nr:hypothetical protein [Nostoc paludosum FACHB-159]